MTNWSGEPSRMEWWTGDDGALNVRLRLNEDDMRAMDRERFQFLMAELEDIRQILSEIKPGYIDVDSVEAEPLELREASS